MIEKNVSLKNYNTFKLDATAEVFFTANNLEDIKDFFLEFPEAKDNLTILGGGSNILFRSESLKYVLNIELKGIEKIKEDDEHIWIKVGAGEIWHDFLKICLDNNWNGLENLALIPGKVGAAPIQNIGAYGTEQKEFFHSAEVYNIAQDNIFEIANEHCEFGYRDSIFKRAFNRLFIILSVTYKLNKTFKPNLTYKDLKNLEGTSLTPENLFNRIIEIRNSKLPNPEFIGNAGSFFKNPIISEQHFSKLKSIYPETPIFTQTDGNYKIPAAWLIEQCDWKGKILNGAGVSPQHSLILINLGKANGEDVYFLSELIIDSVKEKFNIELEREVNLV